MISWILAAALAGSPTPDAARLESDARVALAAGDHARAEALLIEAVILREGADDGEALACDLSWLGYLAQRRDDLDRAEAWYRRALTVEHRRAPGGREVASLHEALGDLALRRVDIGAANAAFAEALALRTRIDPAEPGRDRPLAGLGTAARLAEDLELAEALLGQALAVRVARDPASDEVVETLDELAWVAHDAGRLDEALERSRRIEAIEESHGHQSMALAGALELQGRAAWMSLDLVQAFELLERARTIVAREAPASMREADLEFALGWSRRQLGQDEEAARHLCRLVDLVEEGKLRSGGTESARAGLAGRLGDYYNDCLDLLVALGREREAFATFERARAHRFRALLEKADRTRGPAAPLAAPPSLDVRGAQSLLEPGTTLLAYSVGVDHTLLFVLTAKEFAVRSLPVGREGLTTRVTQLRLAIDGPRRAPAALARFDDTARALYRDLIAAGGPAATSARRLLICPDGPLHALPFAALRRNDGPASFLVERTTVHLALSASVYAQIVARERTAPGGPVIAFGDPVYPPGGARVADERAAYARARGARLAPLPETRREVQRIQALFPRALARLGSDAREEGVKALAGEVRYLHLACHGLLDGRAPMESALVLSPPVPGSPSSDDGVLHAREIADALRLRADLVTLSACSSALGTEVVGEGIQGLTRAFHQAGARSVVASLWEVSDRSTAELMGAFYEGLRAGRSKDRALAAAQRSLIRGRVFAHPYHWAAFQLSGDWR